MLKGSLEVVEFDPRQLIPDAVPPYHPPQSDYVPGFSGMFGSPFGGALGSGSLAGQQQTNSCSTPGVYVCQQQTNPQNPCQSAGGAPSPQTFADDGRTLASQPPSLLNGLDDLSFLLEFRRGGMLDAQNGGKPGGSNAAYANYAFGAFFSGLGWPLPYALQAANAYGSVNSTYPANMLKASDPNFPAIPPANVTNITAGYNAAAAGALCHPK